MQFKYDDYKESGIELLSKLIEYQSVLEEFDPNSDEPFGLDNKKALEFILDYAKNDGFKVFNDENYAGHIEFGDGEDEEEAMDAICLKIEELQLGKEI